MIEIKDIEKLADLARLEIPEEEKAGFQKDLENILKYVGQIEDANIKTEKIEKSDDALVNNVMREDHTPHETGAFTEEILAEMPDREGDYLKVKKIL
ncbi:MAG: Asp-tRNA(Asn)/Glu-tRNA(Gln) amidotransferase subunit GatC [Candidatus Paceibacterota bacterium]